MPPGEGWEVTTPTVPSEIPGGLRTGAKVAGIGLSAINVIQTLKFAGDFKKTMDFGDSLRSGQYFQDFWSQISALPDGAKVEMDHRAVIGAGHVHSEPALAVGGHLDGWRDRHGRHEQRHRDPLQELREFVDPAAARAHRPAPTPCPRRQAR